MSEFYKEPLFKTRFMINSKHLQEVLRAYIHENGLTYSRAALRFGISKTFLANLINGRRINMGATVLARISVWTGAKIEDFLIRLD